MLEGIALLLLMGLAALAYWLLRPLPTGRSEQASAPKTEGETAPVAKRPAPALPEPSADPLPVALPTPPRLPKVSKKPPKLAPLAFDPQLFTDDDATMVASTASLAMVRHAIAPRFVEDVPLDADPRAIPRLHVMGAFRTHRGQRDRHEDAFAALRNATYVIADGVGGHAGGSVASRTAIEAVERAFRDEAFGHPQFVGKVPSGAREVVGAMLASHFAVQARAAEDPALEGMGTTLVVMRADALRELAVIASVGDSRCYRVRDGKVEQLTVDHVSQEMVKGTTRRVLSQAIGIGTPAIDVCVAALRPGDLYLLCTDGLYGELTDEDICATLRDPGDLHAAAGHLVDLAVAKGAKDNVSVVLVSVAISGSSLDRRAV